MGPRNKCGDDKWGVVVIQFSMSVGHSFALGENGYAVFGVGKEAKGCVSAAYAKVPVVWSGGLTQTAPTLLRRFWHSGLHFGPVPPGLPNCLSARGSECPPGLPEAPGNEVNVSPHPQAPHPPHQSHRHDQDPFRNGQEYNLHIGI